MTAISKSTYGLRMLKLFVMQNASDESRKIASTKGTSSKLLKHIDGQNEKDSV